MHDARTMRTPTRLQRRCDVLVLRITKILVPGCENYSMYSDDEENEFEPLSDSE